MSQPQSGYPPQGHPGQDPYGQMPAQPGYDGVQQPAQPDSGPAPAGGRSKRRAYAGQAYDFAAGGNASLNDPQSAAYTGAQPGLAGYPAQEAQQGYQQPGYGVDQGQAAAGFSSPGIPGVGGYQPPTQGYPGPGASPAPGGVGGMAQQFGNMGIGADRQAPAQNQQRAPLNQLYPTDLLNQPFNVSELDFPPPPIVLPPNVSDMSDLLSEVRANICIVERYAFT